MQSHTVLTSQPNDSLNDEFVSFEKTPNQRVATNKKFSIEKAKKS